MMPIRTLVCIKGRPEVVTEEVEELDDFTSKYTVLMGGTTILDHVRGHYSVNGRCFEQCEAIQIETDTLDYGSIFKKADEAIRNGTIRTRF
ncbi:hypothetical protein AVV27_gp44 [Achromobacter phage 83-24]|uniref:Uncharacterized protein n=1 Tax=Achromobacter phage 83-24 TaxID=1589747 RepID=A0A0B4ZZJ9_9CAUD|nr:hypothetical protein AVV27_gp44 [Achromobacter phage 83-24]AJD82877.1 hypothetical protein JWAP_00044 [Achromobacter phage 83-24]